MQPTDVIVIGAGPYGLSLAAYLQAAGVNFRIFGKAMQSWSELMPAGMLLKSWPCSSSLYDPGATYTLRHYCEERGIAYHDSMMPLPVEMFVDYGRAFRAKFGIGVEPKFLTNLQSTGQGYRATFDDGEVVMATNVVMALGVHPFKRLPRSLASLPREFVSHSAEYGPLAPLKDKDVVILGAGASASGLAALL